jgi:predicted dehydrogenase
MPKKIILVGLGAISETHVAALESLSEAEIVAGVDTDTSKTLNFRNIRLPVFSNVKDAIESCQANATVIATPTGTHYETCLQALDSLKSPASVFMEKPCADNLNKVKQLFAAIPTGITLQVMYHAAYAPEVLWAVQKLPVWLDDYGEIVSYNANFTDALRDQPERAKSLISSWLDSGINALSIAHRLVQLEAVHNISQPDANEYVASLRFRSGQLVGEGAVRTSWNVKEPAKKTEVQFKSGVQLMIDHQSAEAWIERIDGEKIQAFIYKGKKPRLVAHYIALYENLLEGEDKVFDVAANIKLHELLFSNQGNS